MKIIQWNGGGHLRSDGYVLNQLNGRRVLQHVAIAERALGKRLPPGAAVHHVDENKSNNAPTNLVICQDAAYHQLLHVRTKALDACGNASWRPCRYCKKYDDPANMYQNPMAQTMQHRECRRIYARDYKIRKHLGLVMNAGGAL